MAEIQFIKGIDEETVPEIRLTRSKDGNTGTAIFSFINPTVFILHFSSQNYSEITGMYLQDDEGELVTRNVTANFINGKPKSVEAVYLIRNKNGWDRLMRFIHKYAADKNMSFYKS
nr:photosystem II protein W [Cyanidiaceae sp.]